MKRKLVVTMALAAMALVAVIVSSAGADNRAPVAPQVSAAVAGVNPDVVPGEESTLQTPAGPVHSEVSPCIRTDTAGYSVTELSNLEWCMYAPGKVPAGNTAPPVHSGDTIVYLAR